MVVMSSAIMLSHMLDLQGNNDARNKIRQFIA